MGFLAPKYAALCMLLVFMLLSICACVLAGMLAWTCACWDACLDLPVLGLNRLASPDPHTAFCLMKSATYGAVSSQLFYYRAALVSPEPEMQLAEQYSDHLWCVCFIV